MTKPEFSLISTVEDVYAQEHTVEILYDYRPGRPAQLYGPPERCYPAEGPEVDLRDVRELIRDFRGERWFDAGAHIYNKVVDLLDDTDGDLFVDLCQFAEDCIEGQRESAMEAAAETRREISERFDDA
jgi:hypothetical protein